MKVRSIASPKALLALVLGLVPVAATGQTLAQPVLQPGAGDLLSFGVIKVGPDTATIRFPALEAKGRVRGIKIVPQENPCTIEGVTITYRNGQVHKETVNAALKAGMPTVMFDARFDERFIETIDVTVKKGTCTGAMLEVLAAQSPDALADLRRPRTRSVSNEPTASANLPYNPVEVYYGTNRRQGDLRVRAINVKTPTYSGDPGPVEFGKAIVSVPVNRDPGMNGPWYDVVIKSLNLPRNVLAKDFTMLGIEPMQEGPFVQAMRAKVSQATRFKGQAFVFVHGYYVTFDDAAFRAAQIAADMKFDGLPLMFSWPSAGRADSYAVDLRRAIDAKEALTRFLTLVASQSGATEVHLIAHSMGSAALLEALEWMQRPGQSGAPRFGELVFAAPDVLAEKFARSTQLLRSFGRGLTLYASKNDRALLSSDFLTRGLIPAGMVPASGVPVLGDGLESIDVTALNTSYFAFNHSTFGDAVPLLKDMAAMFAASQRQLPSNRDQAFKEVIAKTQGGRFWRWQQ